VWGGVAYELLPHSVWVRDAELFAILKRRLFFSKYQLFKARGRGNGSRAIMAMAKHLLPPHTKDVH
jgi:hypothetical protein